MSKPSDDLSALFRSLRPDESVFQENATSGARDAQQRWPLFKAVAPQKPQDAPALTEQERQRWVNQEKPAVRARKPALSLPGLSDKMSKSLDKMSVQAVKNTAPVKPATRRELEKYAAEGVVEQPLAQPSERAQPVSAEPVTQANAPINRIAAVKKDFSAVSVAGSQTGHGVFDKKPTLSGAAQVSIPAVPAVPERDLPVARHGDESLKSIFGRLQAKPEVEVKPVVKRSSFLDRLGKR